MYSIPRNTRAGINSAVLFAALITRGFFLISDVKNGGRVEIYLARRTRTQD
jgi:hypothetical protein